MNVSTLQRRFKSAYGTTAADYIRDLKLQRAREAILVRGLSVGEAAYQSGYAHSSNFISAFKKRFGLTPAALVKVHRSL